jgi:hypothetical protein
VNHLLPILLGQYDSYVIRFLGLENCSGGQLSLVAGLGMDFYPLSFVETNISVHRDSPYLEIERKETHRPLCGGSLGCVPL